MTGVHCAITVVADARLARILTALIKCKLQVQVHFVCVVTNIRRRKMKMEILVHMAARRRGRDWIKLHFMTWWIASGDRLSVCVPRP